MSNTIKSKNKYVFVFFATTALFILHYTFALPSPLFLLFVPMSVFLIMINTNQKKGFTLLLIVIMSCFLLKRCIPFNTTHTECPSIFVSNKTYNFFLKTFLHNTCYENKLKYVNLSTCCAGEHSSQVLHHAKYKNAKLWILSGNKNIDRSFSEKYNITHIPSCKCEIHHEFPIFSYSCMLNVANETSVLIKKVLNIETSTALKMFHEKLKGIYSQAKELAKNNKNTIISLGPISVFFDEIRLNSIVLIQNIHSEPTYHEIEAAYNISNKGKDVIVFVPKNHLNKLIKILQMQKCKIVEYDANSNEPIKELQSILKNIDI